jgi:hypothetical protein
MDQSSVVSERTCFEQMVCDVAGALVKDITVEALKRIGDTNV